MPGKNCNGQDGLLYGYDRVQVNLPAELLEVAGVNGADPSHGAAMLLAVELYRENRVSLGRAAELCQTPIELFMVFAGLHEIPMHYGVPDLEEYRGTLERLGA